MTRTPFPIAKALPAALAAGTAAVLTVLLVPAPGPRAEDARADGRYLLAAVAGAGAGAFVTDSATGDTMFCTPRECRRLSVRAAAGPGPQTGAAAPQSPATVDEILRAAPPDLALPPPDAEAGAGQGGVHPALRDF